MRRDADALAGDHVLRHLDGQLLPLAKELVDRRHRGFLGARLAEAVRLAFGLAGLGGLVRRAEAVEVLHLLADVGDVEERVLLEPHVHEGRLHAGKDAGHAPLVDVPDDAALLAALDLHLGDAAVLEHRHAGLALARRDEEHFQHRGGEINRRRRRRLRDGGEGSDGKAEEGAD